jgi:hypothetical protein
MIGEVLFMGKKTYVVVNREGTVRVLPNIKIRARLYLECMQGMGRYESVEEVTKFCLKWAKKKNRGL